jgi:hypothetical protein
MDVVTHINNPPQIHLQAVRPIRCTIEFFNALLGAKDWVKGTINLS